jgi:pimeloyl-ACP methyl ester carboxylesterase/DNA-binding CsgD family transcriptional regulator
LAALLQCWRGRFYLHEPRHPLRTFSRQTAAELRDRWPSLGSILEPLEQNPSMTGTPGPSTQKIRFCSTGDGVSIAYAVAGAGRAFVKTPNWLNHLELDVVSPVWRGWIARMSQRYRLIRYDGRGCGLSDRDASVGSFAANQLDLEGVVAAAGLTRFVLFGASQGAAIAIEYAARHPDRVSHLIIYGGYLRGVLKRDPPRTTVEEAQTLLKIVELGWGRENSAFRQVFASQFIPDSTLEQLRAFDEIQRRTIEPEAAAKLLASFYDIDVSALAAAVVCPTLVLHAREDARIPFEQGRHVASAIRGAEFVSLESRNHILLDHQPAWQQFFDEVDGFLRRHGGADADAASSLGELTPGEVRVLDLVAAGLNNAQIAAKLGLRPKTVRNHINHIFNKLELPDRSRAIVMAREAGLGLSVR